MHAALQALLASAPILLSGVLLLGLRWPAKRVMPIAFFLTIGVALGPWQVAPARVAAATVKGLFSAFDVLYIVFGAVLLLQTLERSGGVHVIRRDFGRLSQDRRVQVLLVAWLFGGFIEGAAGFGAPAAVAAPLMVAMGFPPACAVMLGMMVQSTPVTFGAVGTPILLGVSTGFGEPFIERAAREGVDVLSLVGARAAAIHAIVGTLMPTLMVAMMTRFFGADRSLRHVLSILPLTLAAGLAFTLPYVVAAHVLGPEFPSLLGGGIGLLVMMLVVRRGWWQPARRWDFPSNEEWPPAWGGAVVPAGGSTEHELSSARAWAPYVLLAALLVLTRLDLGVGALLKRVEIVWPAIFGTALDARTSPLYLPGTILTLVVLLTARLHRLPAARVRDAFTSSFRVVARASLVLLFTVPMVRVMMHSDENAADLASMPLALAAWVSHHAAEAWPALAAGVGALGAFIAGSNTVSNMMLVQFQAGVAHNLDLNVLLMVALQTVGAAAGNMIAIHNVVAASASVGFMGQEGATLRKTLIPTLFYLAAVGLMGLVGTHALTLADPLRSSP